MDSANTSTVSTTEFEQSITVAATDVFNFVSDVKNVPQYLPTVKSAQPQEGERIRTQGQAGECA